MFCSRISTFCFSAIIFPWSTISPNFPAFNFMPFSIYPVPKLKTPSSNCSWLMEMRLIISIPIAIIKDNWEVVHVEEKGKKSKDWTKGPAPMIFFSIDLEFLCLINCFFWQIALNHFQQFPFIPKLLIFSGRLVCWTASKAFEKFR